MKKHQHRALAALAAAAIGLLGCATSGRDPQAAGAAPPAAAPAGTPPLLGAGVISKGEEYGVTFTPDGSTAYFARRHDGRRSAYIYTSRLEGGRWTEPQVAEFSGRYTDVEPFITPDGSRLFFASKRPAEGDAPRREFDLWYVARAGAGWGPPQRLPPPVNTDGYENYPVVAADGTLYFGSTREGGAGGVDLYRAGGGYERVESLGAPFNTAGDDADPYVTPDQNLLIFSSTRAGGVGEGDLYVSFKRGDRWTEPRPLGGKINTAEWDYAPLLSADRSRLYFSRGWGNIYQVEARELNLTPGP